MSPPLHYIIFVVLLSSPITAVLAQTSNEDTRNPYGYARVTPSMAIIIVVLIAALFFMGFFSIYIRHRGNLGTGGSVPGANNGGRSRRSTAARGLDATVIETFPTLVYSEVKGLKIGKGELECAVCLCEFEDDETLRLLPKCDHAFHPDCIDAWLVSHTTCPVCRANLAPQPDDPPVQTTGSTPDSSDLEAQNDTVAVEVQPEVCQNDQVDPPAPEVISAGQTLNRNRTRGSRSDRPNDMPRWFPRSHSTGHSLVQPGENTDRFTLKLPAEIRKEIMNRELNRTMSMVVFSRERSSRRGYKPGGGEGSSRGKYKRLERTDRAAKSERSTINRTPSFMQRASSFLTRASSLARSTKVTTSEGEGSSSRVVGPDAVQSTRPPV
ncbi:E3 ubiquitin-protein ligase ATL6 [Mercurialis annua]|uniref:E3 ubiquitin-protein ligase ATL6 n=1 Tax=Mercurialis annua TaxID=3986 RepID=UPI00215E0599|nr:E3 ubiquitin-protein ligase ATL6 [Mercurialis annua]